MCDIIWLDPKSVAARLDGSEHLVTITRTPLFQRHQLCDVLRHAVLAKTTRNEDDAFCVSNSASRDLTLGSLRNVGGRSVFVALEKKACLCVSLAAL